MDQSNFVQKFLRSELSFYTTLVASVLAFAGLYYGITNQVNLIGQRLELHIIQTVDLPSRTSSLEKDVAVLQAKLTRQ